MKNETIRHSRFFAVPVFLSIAAMLIFPGSVFPQNTYTKDPSYIESVLDKSRQMKLSEERYWLVLGHYRKGTFGYKSQVDDPRFFLDPDGKADPKAELETTIRSMFDENDDENLRTVNRFAARFAWLKERLAIDDENLPYPACTRFEELMKKEKPAGVTLVYPAGFINSPASMYGHTFLIVELEGKSRLVSSAINYMAQTDESFGLLFAFRGFMGYYPGYFSMMPYYQKVSEYSDFEKRNIWEYSLNLTKQETERMLMHVAELDTIYSKYYFLDENCSYNLLWLLEAARPSLHLIEKMGMFVAPIDTIREVGANDVIRDVTFRPSKNAKMEFLAEKISVEQRSLSIQIARGKKNPEDVLSSSASPTEKKIILEFAGEYLQVLRGSKKITSEEYSRILIPVLKARSTLGRNDESSDTIPVPHRPENSHNSNRILAGCGWRDGEFFQEFSWRPTYHALVDIPEGYSFGEEIVFCNFAARYYDKENRFVLKSFDAVDALSIPASSTFAFNWGWKIRTGLAQQRLHDGADHLAAYFNSGGGAAADVPFLGRAYLFLEGEGNGSKEIDRYMTAGFGGTAGILNSVSRWYTAHLYVQSLYYPLTERHLLIKSALSQRISFSLNTALIIDLSAARQYGEWSKEATASFNVYF